MADTFKVANNTIVKPEPKFKVGDYVVCSVFGGSKNPTGQIIACYPLESLRIGSTYDYTIKIISPTVGTVFAWFIEKNIIRLANDSEIAFFVLSVE